MAFGSFNGYVKELICQLEAVNVDLEARNSYGYTALHAAIILGQVEQTKMLLERGADVNAAGNDGKTALILAVTANHANELLQLLIKYGADVFVKDKRRLNALHQVAYQPGDRSDLARVLLEKSVSLLEEMDLWQYQPIHWAAYKQNHKCLKVFLDHGANVNARTGRDGKFPLYFAVDSGMCYDDNKILKVLLERGADVHMKTIKGRTALHRACERYQQEHVKLLLSAGADVLAEDYNGKTPFSLIYNHKDRGLRITNIIQLKYCIIKALALKKICLQPSIELKDEKIMKEYSDKVLWNYYQDCCTHLIRMKFTRFAEGSTFLELLTKSHNQIAGLMRNPEFEANFALYDLSGFSMYAEDVQRAFELAQRQCYFMQKRENVINEAVYHILPDVVVRKVTRYLWLWDD